MSDQAITLRSSDAAFGWSFYVRFHAWRFS
jgi:hypothetical protein